MSSFLKTTLLSIEFQVYFVLFYILCLDIGRASEALPLESINDSSGRRDVKQQITLTQVWSELIGAGLPQEKPKALYFFLISQPPLLPSTSASQPRYCVLFCPVSSPATLKEYTLRGSTGHILLLQLSDCITPLASVISSGPREHTLWTITVLNTIERSA